MTLNFITFSTGDRSPKLLTVATWSDAGFCVCLSCLGKGTTTKLHSRLQRQALHMLVEFFGQLLHPLPSLLLYSFVLCFQFF